MLGSPCVFDGIATQLHPRSLFHCACFYLGCHVDNRYSQEPTIYILIVPESFEGVAHRGEVTDVDAPAVGHGADDHFFDFFVDVQFGLM